MAHTILLIEDDQASANLIKEALASEDFVFVHAGSCAEGWRCFETLRPALAVLDVGLPDGSGLDLCRRIRSHPALGSTPVVLLTGKAQFEDKSSGFEAGADHYLVKPLQIAELRLWISALLRRVQFADKEGGVLRLGDFAIDPQAHTVTISGAVIRNLTRKEFDLLYELARRSPRVLSKDYVMKSLWNTVLRDNTIEVHVRNVRAKLGASAKRLITVSGVGYRFE